MNNIREDIWVERYRPQTLDEIILPERLKTFFTKLIKKKEIPNMLFSGPQGTGKTTMAKIIAKNTGANFLFINASNERGIDTLRNKVQTFASTASLVDDVVKLVIFDEADNMHSTYQSALRNFIETFYKNCRFIFTCNYPSKIFKEIHSRLQEVDFTWTKEDRKILIKDFGRRVFNILEKENVDVKDKQQKMAVVNYIKRIFPDMRKILNELQSYSKANNTIDEGLLMELEEGSMGELYQALKEKKFKHVREFAKNLSIKNVSIIVRKFYDDMDIVFHNDSKTNLILLLHKYMVESTLCHDDEITLAAMFIHIMLECEFK